MPSALPTAAGGSEFCSSRETIDNADRTDTLAEAATRLGEELMVLMRRKLLLPMLRESRRGQELRRRSGRDVALPGPAILGQSNGGCVPCHAHGEVLDPITSRMCEATPRPEPSARLRQSAPRRCTGCRPRAASRVAASFGVRAPKPPASAKRGFQRGGPDATVPLGASSNRRVHAGRAPPSSHRRCAYMQSVAA